MIVGIGMARSAARGRRARGAHDPLPVRRERRALPAAGGPRRARLAADAGRPTDSAAVVRALTRPPVELRSIDLARCTAIARRRKLDMISALHAGLESPQLPPEARDRIQAFLKLHDAASRALEEMRADVFVRRLIERIGLRRHRLFVATPEAAERLQSLSRLSELAAEWTQREPRGSVRDFVRHLTAVADAGELETDDVPSPSNRAVVLAEPDQVKGLEFAHVYLLGLHRGAIALRDSDPVAIPADLLADHSPGQVADPALAPRARLAYLSMTRATTCVGRVVAGGGGRGVGRPLGLLRDGPRRARRRRGDPRGGAASAPLRGSTRPTECFGTRPSRRHGEPGRRFRRCASTRPRT